MLYLYNKIKEGKNLYYLVDYASPFNWMPYLEGYAFQYKCLYKGRKKEELENVAPHLAQIKKKSFLNWWQADLIGKATGIYICSDKSFDEIWTHCRKYTQYIDDEGKSYMSRYYDPRIFNLWVKSLKDDVVRKLFDGIDFFACEDEYTPNKLVVYKLFNDRVKLKIRDIKEIDFFME